MLLQLLEWYLWAALFTAISILYEWPLTGSKANYTYMKIQLNRVAEDSLTWFIIGYMLMLALGALLWPYTFYCRAHDVWRGR